MGWSVVLGFFTVVTTAPSPPPPVTPPPPTSASSPKPPGKPPVPRPPLGKPNPKGPDAAATNPAPATAAPAGTRPPVAHVRHVVRPPPLEPDRPAPNVKLTIVAPSTRRLWAMHVENLEAVPVRLVADAHLLSFDVMAPGKEQPVHCILPRDMRPADDEDRVLVIPPKRSYGETFDPRLYCFGVHETPALTAGATVVAHLGWAAASGHRSQLHVLSPIEGVSPEVGSARELVSDTFTIPADTVAAPAAPVASSTPPLPDAAPGALGDTPRPPGALGDTPKPPGAPDDGPKAAPSSPGEITVNTAPKLVLELPARVDVQRPDELNVVVRLANEDTHPVTLLFRSEVVGFVAFSAGNATHCRWPSQSDSPIRELYTTLRPREKTSTTVLLPDLCGSQFFDTPGLYVLRGQLDTRHASGASIGLRTFDGQLVAQAPMLVRIRAAKDGKARPRPTLE